MIAIFHTNPPPTPEGWSKVRGGKIWEYDKILVYGEDGSPTYEFVKPEFIGRYASQYTIIRIRTERDDK